MASGSDELLRIIESLPAGYSKVSFEGSAYGLTKAVFNDGRSFKVYAEELGGSDFISLNYYCTGSGQLLKPCEMPVEKVVRFLRGLTMVPQGAH